MKRIEAKSYRQGQLSDVLDLLRFELKFLEDGGYGRSVRTPWKPTSIFQDSPTCINFADAHRTRPCEECLLLDFVPPDRRTQTVPCHHIPLNSAGETVEKLLRRGNQEGLEDTVAAWLRAVIEHLQEKEIGTNAPLPSAEKPEKR